MQPEIVSETRSFRRATSRGRSGVSSREVGFEVGVAFSLDSALVRAVSAGLGSSSIAVLAIYAVDNVHVGFIHEAERREALPVQP